ncbi:MAG TPA: PrsW family glutamic-type intramembrane protease, partial [Candidatus Mcinerneyibacteriales bacterium]|nr:PrsW family glutamic-type intramembrane protease [Candidatus Mcinerneyibacteriales bacterium]
ALLRALLSVPGHFLFSTIWAYGLAGYKFRTGRGRPLHWAFLLMAMAAHALFNAIALFNILGGLLFIALMTFLWIRFNRSVRLLLSLSPFRTKKIKT